MGSEYAIPEIVAWCGRSISGSTSRSPPTWDKNSVVMTNHIAVGSIIDGCLGARHRPHATAAGAVSQRGDGVV